MKIRCINNRYKDTWSDVERKYLFLTEGEIYETDEDKWNEAKDFNTVPIVIEDGSKVYFQKKRFEPVEDIPRYVDTEDLVKPVKGITLGEYERMRREEEKVVEGAKFELKDDINSREVLFKEITDDLFEVYKMKNNDYGNSVGDTYQRYGDVSFLVRIEDKINRLKSLTVDNKKQQVADEKVEDTIKDLINYGILWYIERLINNKGE